MILVDRSSNENAKMYSNKQKKLKEGISIVIFQRHSTLTRRDLRTVQTWSFSIAIDHKTPSVL